VTVFRYSENCPPEWVSVRLLSLPTAVVECVMGLAGWKTRPPFGVCDVWIPAKRMRE
jgi:hypothetical protein